MLDQFATEGQAYVPLSLPSVLDELVSALAAAVAGSPSTIPS